MSNQTTAPARQLVEDYLRRQIVGPRGGPDEVLDVGRPESFYSAGILYPSPPPIVSASQDGDDGALSPADDVNEGELSAQDYLDDPVALSSRSRPSALGISFRVRGPNISLHVTISGATYSLGERVPNTRDRWQRHPYLREVEVSPPAPGQLWSEIDLDDAPLKIRTVWRRREEAAILTLSLINTHTLEQPNEWPRTDQCFFQAAVEARPADARATFVRFHEVGTLSPDPEERELDLLYRRHATFGIGHGCSIGWDEPAGSPSTRHLWSSILPTHTMRRLDYELPPEDARNPLLQHVLSTQHLAVEGSDTEIITWITALCEAYEYWIGELSGKPENADIPEHLSAERDALIERARNAARRMRRGVQALRDSATAMSAFRLANTAMAMQSRHSRPDYGGTTQVDPLPFVAPDYWDGSAMRWRPFQLAFLLLNIESISTPASADREIVDLIWFPTGGGKTEAYLAVTAFTVFYRRLAYREAGGGTSTLMRYSLRLLTSQQFERACALICACEMIRRSDEARLGHEPVSIGLWVGEDVTPNTFHKAVDVLEQAGDDNPFPLRRCPWCGAMIQPGPIAAPASRGIDASTSDFRLFCVRENCPFTARLPVNFIDQYLYANPPTMLIATVDKFAQLPWDERGGAFFALPQVPGQRPPDLIIQDELHLMSGPLGTIVGVYETAIDEMCRRGNVRAKVIASTATIRRAPEQVRSLYGREVLQFPPAGLHADDSYFARMSEEEDRRYVGVLLPSVTGTTAAVRVFAAILQAPIDVALQGIDLDTYWTVVGYFNSLRELGKALTLASDDIPAWMQVIGTSRRPLPVSAVQDLTSKSVDDLPAILERLKLGPPERHALSLVLSSSILSVGVDVGRLGMMIVNGQPKTTSEYIQASSRVGRAIGRPGLVVALYSPTKPRDRSHYERFQAYHSALYRYVEPASVTPFSPPARARALRAVLVALARHVVPGLGGNGDAGSMTEDIVQSIVNTIVERVQRVDPGELSDARAEVEAAVREWAAWASDPGRRLHYCSRTAQYRDLLHEPTDTGAFGWPALHSMRNVDVESLVRLTR